MAMVVNHNIPALSTYNVINNTSSALQKSINKLSTGLRINSAADDAAGLAISEKMRAQVRGLDQAVSNSQDGISMIQTAEGALSETHSILQRMRELSVQAANDTLTQQDRGYIQEEVDQLREEITRIGNTTQFNKKKLLNGDAAVLWSSSDNETKAIVNGGLRQIDQFGQKKSVEGNYKINIKADPGQGEVQKSDIFKIKHPDVVLNKNLNSEAGVTDVAVKDVPAASYTLKGAAVAAGADVTGAYKVGGTKYETEATLTHATLTDGVATDVIKGTLWMGDVELGSYTFAGNTDGKAELAAIKTNVINAAAAAGVTIDDSFDGETIKATTINKEAPSATSFKITYAHNGTGTTEAADVSAVVAGTGSTTTAAIGYDDVLTADAGNLSKTNASILFEVTNVDAANKNVTVRATASILSAEGVNSTQTTEMTLTEDTAAKLTDFFGSGTTASVTLKANQTTSLTEGSKFVYNFHGADADMQVAVTGANDPTWEEKWDNGPLYDAKNKTAGKVSYGLMDSVAGNDIHLKNFYLNEKTGEATEGDIIISTGGKFTKANVTDDKFLGGFDAAFVGKVAGDDVKLRDLDKFWDSEGNFMLTDPQTITLTQGDGKQASVTLYANDTLGDVAKKFNDAVAEGLGQGQYVNDASKFVTFVGNQGGTNSESVPGTFLIRTVVPGASGKISLSGDEAVINAFSLNTIQDAKETSYTINVRDAHTNTNVATDVKTTGNIARGLIHENIDVEFDAMSGISAKWDAGKNAYTYTTEKNGVDTTLHLSDNTTVFQIGANEGEDMGVNIGDMRSHALGLDAVNVTNRASAARSITVIDNAIDKVSMQRSKLGAYQNRLEHTINNLTTASENLTAAESRIRDTDMAKEMMNFSKLQIMLQAGNSMLAQANQLPQNVLSLVR